MPSLGLELRSRVPNSHDGLSPGSTKDRRELGALIATERVLCLTGSWVAAFGLAGLFGFSLAFCMLGCGSVCWSFSSLLLALLGFASFRVVSRVWPSPH